MKKVIILYKQEVFFILNKLVYYSELADKYTKELSRKENWIDFLKIIGQMYKYPFDEQILISAQRPDTKACAKIEIWNNPMNRRVKRGSKGIALVDNTGIKPCLKYVFAYEDTMPEKLNAHEPFIWKMKKEHEPDIIQMFKAHYSDLNDTTDDMGTIISSIAQTLSMRYYKNNSKDIINEQSANFSKALTISLTYSILLRCGIDTEKYINKEDFSIISDFNTVSSIQTLGIAVSQLSEQILREIEVTVKKYERNKLSERSEAIYGLNLQAKGRLSDPEYNIAGNDGIHRQIRGIEKKLSERTQGDTVLHNDSAREIVSPSIGDRQDSEQPSGTDDTRNDKTITTTEQRDESNGLGGSYEQPESGSRGNHSERTDLQLNNKESEPSKNSLDGSFFSITSDVINIFSKSGTIITASETDNSIYISNRYLILKIHQNELMDLYKNVIRRSKIRNIELTKNEILLEYIHKARGNYELTQKPYELENNNHITYIYSDKKQYFQYNKKFVDIMLSGENRLFIDDNISNDIQSHKMIVKNIHGEIVGIVLPIEIENKLYEHLVDVLPLEIEGSRAERDEVNPTNDPYIGKEFFDGTNIFLISDSRQYNDELVYRVRQIKNAVISNSAILIKANDIDSRIELWVTKLLQQI